MTKLPPFLVLLLILSVANGASGAGLGSADFDQPTVYQVPWQIVASNAQLPVPPGTSLVVLWFPADMEKAKDSPLLTSRVLTLAAARGVADMVVPGDVTALREAYKIAADQDTAVLAGLDGKEIGRVSPDAKGQVDLWNLEKLINNEIKDREKALKLTLAAAEKRANAGDKSAVNDLQQVWAHRLMFPSFGKRAAKALEGFGIEAS